MRRALPLIVSRLVLAGAGLVVAALVAGACGSGDEAPATTAALKIDRFDRDRAFADLRYQVELGPRPAGSERGKQLAQWLKDRLPRGR